MPLLHLAAGIVGVRPVDLKYADALVFGAVQLRIPDPLHDDQPHPYLRALLFPAVHHDFFITIYD